MISLWLMKFTKISYIINRFRDVVSGVKVKSKLSTTLMHHKFCIVDCPSRVNVLSPSNTRISLGQRLLLRLIGNPHRGLLITGSMNWTQQAVNGNWDHVLVTSHLPLLNQFQEEYEYLWSSFPDLSIRHD